jgi:hypothetical protein|tara:strand:- start:244 stop:1308 length:1065 start_codon:yes stop_codon:yes gene_type:complete
MSKAADLANLIGNINAGGGGVNKNVIINGDFKIKQRAGTGTQSTDLGASSGYHLHDRWNLDFSSTAGRLTMSHDSSAPSGFANSMKLACTTADTSIASGEFFQFEQLIEGQNLQAFAKGTSDAKPFAVSFYVKGNASATYICELFDSDNSRQVSKTFNVTTDWTRVKLNFPADTTGAFNNDNASSLAFIIHLHAGSNYTSGTLNTTWDSVTQANRAVGISSFFDSTDRTFFITGIQLEVGQNPTEFEHETFEKTLHKCYRYYYRESLGGLGIGSSYANGAWNYVGMIMPVTMRADPTASYSGGTSSGTWHSSATSKGVSAKKGVMTVYQKCNGTNLDIYIGGSDPLIPILDAEL